MTRSAERRPIGILGGTFDPLHHGHLRLGEDARGALGLERVLLVPCGVPAHRPAPLAAAVHRLEMVRLGIRGNPFFELECSEAQSSAPSYTVVTLARLRERFGAARPLVLLLGADAFRELASWHRWRELFSLAHLAVTARPGSAFDPERLAEPLAAEYARRAAARLPAGAASGAIVQFAATPLAISASRIRAALARSASVRYLLPDSVLDYIDRHHLYRDER